MTATRTPTEPTRRKGGIVALVIVGVVVLAIVAGLAIMSLLGLFVITSSSGTPPTVVEEPVPVAPIADGETFAFVREVGSGHITIDPARMLSGAEAREAAQADGVIPPGEDLPNDFYIDNPESDPLSLPVASDLSVTVLHFDDSGSISEIDITLQDLATAFEGVYTEAAIYGLVAGEFPMTVVVEEGTVVDMTQVYLP